MHFLKPQASSLKPSQKRPCRIRERMKRLILLLACLLAAQSRMVAIAQTAVPRENDYYRLEPLPIPDDVVLEVGAMDLLPSGQLATSSRRGEIYLVDRPFAKNLDEIKFQRFAHGLHEVLGLAWNDGWLYAT